MQTLIFSGLHCDSCSRLITKKLSQIPGVKEVQPVSPLGTFKVSGELLTPKQVHSAMDGSDYLLVSME